MKIGDVSKALDMPASTIRYYESAGLIEPPIRVSGVREFDDQALFTLKFVRLAQAAGFSINEMKSLLERYNEDPSPSGMWQSLAHEKRAEVHGKIKELRQTVKVLDAIIDCDCKTLHACVASALKENG